MEPAQKDTRAPHARYELRKTPAESGSNLSRRTQNVELQYMTFYRDDRSVAEIEMGTADYMSSTGSIRVLCENGSLHMFFLDGNCMGVSMRRGSFRERGSSIDVAVRNAVDKDEQVSGILENLKSALLKEAADCTVYLRDFFGCWDEKPDKGYRPPDLYLGNA